MARTISRSPRTHAQLGARSSRAAVVRRPAPRRRLLPLPAVVAGRPGDPGRSGRLAPWTTRRPWAWRSRRRGWLPTWATSRSARCCSTRPAPSSSRPTTAARSTATRPRTPSCSRCAGADGRSRQVGRTGSVDDREAMGLAPAQARLAPEVGDVPIGAVLLDETGAVVVATHNRREVDGDPTALAELLALREAGRARGRWHLGGCTLVVTLEPCTMCAGAIVLSRVDRVVFGAWDPKAGAC